MYTRHFGRKNLKIPEDYCGNAFEREDRDCVNEKNTEAEQLHNETCSISEKEEKCEDKMQSLFEKIGIDRVASPDLLVVLLAFLLMSENTSYRFISFFLLVVLLFSYFFI